MFLLSPVLSFTYSDEICLNYLYFDIDFLLYNKVFYPEEHVRRAGVK